MRLTPLIVILLTGVSFAGEERDALARLASDAPAERAWGAHLAGKQGVRKAIPQLVQMIGRVPERKDEEGRLVLRAAFDALIRLKASVPAKVLEPHLEGYFRTQALILLPGAPEFRTEVLLRSFDRQGGERTGRFGIAVGNLLCVEKAPGFASRLLRRVQQLRLDVSIVEQGFGGRGGSRSLGSRFGDGRLDVPEGFPPTVFHHLTDREREGSVLLAEGPRPIRWYRTEREGRKLGFGSSGSSVELTTLAREWLAVLVDVPVKDLGVVATSGTSLVWTDEAAYVTHVAARRNALLARFWKLATALITRKVLTQEEARALVPQVTVTVLDRRKQPAAGELPKIPGPPKRPVLPGEERRVR